MTPPQPFNLKLMVKVLEDLCAPNRDFSGFISIESGESLYLLFIFSSSPYAAGKTIGDKPFSLSIRDFFREVGLLPDTIPTISVHATDPVLLKSLLIFIQNDPTAKAPTSLINPEAILRQIQQDAADALIILEKQQMLNFFFFKDGTRGKSYFSDTEFRGTEGLTTDEQMLVYAFQHEAEVNALVYRSIATQEATDALLVSREEMLQLLRRESGEDQSPIEEIPVLETLIEEENLLLEVLVGANKGQTLTGAIPCVLGRKDADIIVADQLVSKRHAAIQVVNGKLLLIDLNSTNGTTLNGTHVSQHDIGVGDVIGMGGTSLKVLRITQP